MKTWSNTWKIKQAASCIYTGGIVAYPTEAVYGLGCDPFNTTAITRLLAIKQRPIDHGLILVASEFEQLTPFIASLDKKTLNRVTKTWPGAITWIVPVKPEVPYYLTGNHEGIAVRVSNHPIVKQLCETVGHAIISTSANVHHQPPALSPLSVRRIFGQTVDMILTGSLGSSSKPTEIRDARTNKILRHA